MLEIRLLGPFEVRRDGVPVTLPGRQLVALTSLLALSANRPVPFDVLADRLWGERLPKSVKSTLHTYATRLRKHLGDSALQTHAAGYVLCVEPDQVDALRLAAVLREASGDLSRQREVLTSAIDLWRDKPFVGSPSDWLATGESARLTELHLSAVEQLVDLDLAEGRYDGLPAALQELTTQHPFRESLWHRRIAALRLTDRTAEALECYEQIRSAVADELGVDPSPALQQEYARLLDSDLVGGGFEESSAVGVPRQLPPDVHRFTGRSDEQEQLGKLLDNAPDGQPTFVTLTGPGGAGKTSLAVHWAHQVSERYPDGQLFINLRGFAADAPVLPAVALHGFLQALGVPANTIPADRAERAALFRTATAGKRMLLLIDNARNAEQVRDLLPASGCLVLVTSRNQLRSLSAQLGATRLMLDPLSTADAIGLLAASVGSDRVAAEPEAVEELAGICAGLPLALTVAAESARRSSGSPFADLVRALEDEQHTLDVLADPDDDHADLRRVLSWSYRVLEPEAARLFRLLGLHPATTLRLQAVAALADLDVRAAERHLDRLVAANLVSTAQRGSYQLHDLLRVYAAELTSQLDSGEERQTALVRLLDWYLHTVQNAQRSVTTDASGAFLIRSAHQPLTFADTAAAMRWLQEEQSALVPWIRTAINAGSDEHAWRLAWRLRVFVDMGFLVDEGLETARLGVQAAERLGAPRPRYLAWNVLGSAEYRADRADAAEQSVRRAIEIAAACGDVLAESIFRTNLALARWIGGDLDSALVEVTAAAEVAAQVREPSGEPMQAHAGHLEMTAGAINLLLGRLDVAQAHTEEAVRLTRISGDWLVEAQSLSNLAELYELRDDDATAEFYAAESLDRLQGFSTPTATLAALVVRVRVAVRAGRIADAQTLGRRALALFPAGDARTAEIRELLAQH
ncbi:BTAD domain-containing putative transcriptional regulator [Kribbella sp. NPDC051770]|uniref:AfsR/SARP family transcriptional regulator n=1 Tax=Kribbella sp. NPDC051770 TaxID=3155413 RepID=UPI00342DB994